MTERTGSNALVALGVVLLVVGGIGFVYGQLTVQQQNANDGGGGMLDVTVGGGEEQRSQSLDHRRLVRVGGLVTGVAGAVIALTGGLIE